MNRRFTRAVWIIPALLPLAARAETVSLAELGTDRWKQDWQKPVSDKSVDNHPLTMAEKVFEHGVGSHANSIVYLNLAGAGEKFTAMVGVDDEVKPEKNSARTRVEFKIVGDNKTLFRSGRMKPGDAAKPVEIDLHGIQTLVLLSSAAGGTIDFAHADWADAIITYSGTRPVTVAAPDETVEVLTPKQSDQPRINSAKAFGVRPGHPALFTVAATGQRPMTFSADGLPEGLSIDSQTGRITGSVKDAGEAHVHLKATNALGSAEGVLHIIVGNTIALTPPMGWNSWNCFAGAVSAEKVRAAADAMVSSGLIDHGWTYINVDDCWEVKADEPDGNRRDADGRIKTNAKFTDMKAMADYIHSKGLRAGLYSSPGPATCANFTASYKFEEADARQYAKWGFDYLKYDWCSYGKIYDELRKAPDALPQLQLYKNPYITMHDALAKQDRDIVFSLCQYGMGSVWEWGGEVGGNCWRTTGDINDSWGSMSGIGFKQNSHEKFAKPGNWNDPDMLVVGKVGWGPALHPTRLSPNEQYTHITLWSLLSSPLLIGCDMTQMDGFTLGLLTNDEVIAVNQDPLGHQAARVAQDTDTETEVWAKDLEGGSRAVGLFNRGEMPAKITVKWTDLGLSGKQPVRDLWRQKDLGDSEESFTAEVGRHGTVMLKVGTDR